MTDIADLKKAHDDALTVLIKASEKLSEAERDLSSASCRKGNAEIAQANARKDYHAACAALMEAMGVK